VRTDVHSGLLAPTGACVFCIIVPLMVTTLHSATTNRSLSSLETIYKQRVCIAPRTGRKWSTTVTEHRRKCVSPSSYITQRKTLLHPVSLRIFRSKDIHNDLRLFYFASLNNKTSSGVFNNYYQSDILYACKM